MGKIHQCIHMGVCAAVPLARPTEGVAVVATRGRNCCGVSVMPTKPLEQKKNRKPLKHAGFECLLAFLRPLTGIPDRNRTCIYFLGGNCSIH